jgi:DeoR family fructose operon transcriptional repressor
MSMYAEERQQAMARLVGERGRLSVNDLAEQYDVTTETVRRDLTALERLGLVRRVHGGAVPAGALSGIESALGERDAVRTDEKDRIGKAAAALLPRDGATVLFDAGSTTARVAAALPPDLRLTAFTHSLPVAVRLAAGAHIDLTVFPGRVRRTTQAAVGADTVQAVSHLRADVAFIGTNALSITHGLSTPDPEEAATKRALVNAARRVIVVADSSKLGRESAVRFASLDQVDVLVTDRAASAADIEAIERAGVEVVIA